MPKIYAIIVTYNGMQWIEHCLRCVCQSTMPIEIVIIDNHSTDETISYIRSHFPQAYIIENQENRGFGQANNQGIRYALEQGADYFLLLNQDAYIEPKMIEKLLGAEKQCKNVAILSPVHMNGQGAEMDKNFSTYLHDKANRKLFENDTVKQVRFVNAACWLLPRTTIENIGGFDPLFLHYGEDRDYCQRVQYHQLNVFVCKATNVLHDRKYTQRNDFRGLAHTLRSVGLAKLKDINTSLYKNYIWFICSRLKKMLKWILLGKYANIKIERKNIYDLLKMQKQIQINRKVSQQKNNIFL